MKNKLLKGAHLSERKYREILQLFCDDLTATQIAGISGVSRVTINNYFRMIRLVIAAYCDRYKGDTTVDVGSSKDIMAFSPEGLPVYYGLSMQNGKIGTGWLREVGKESIHHLRSLNTNGSGVSMPVFRGYHAVADCDEWQLYWLHPDVDSASVSNTLSEINGFWTHTKGRLHKFRGMNKKMLYLHIKECEFRYNFRNEDILLQLVHIINNSATAQHFSSQQLRFA
jgi:transposase